MMSIEGDFLRLSCRWAKYNPPTVGGNQRSCS